ncbi:hypothetical protein RO3G_00538 [Rhizopus delemar RA 99-880]|uniref:Uncharacterized protein n=1 Tax=Rhizopus delemar (strain RA 99-880 / ATCC MYA-4621 / FGSC 9543 / NRRL 43880) TaxID=246409 RepID=I1BI04_RHIO9|nr:hypothetical protein RO3G_00538 [Rhizopus delemar RA 99-880]|eukprot:EIE75834.1 hypothetical protein RO3G_00538 [Rhizopus delemar RA 99-880]
MRSRSSMITKLAEKRSVELEYNANESSCHYDENIPTDKVQVVKSLSILIDSDSQYFLLNCSISTYVAHMVVNTKKKGEFCGPLRPDESDGFGETQVSNSADVENKK